MEVGRLLSRWWFVALVSLAVGIPSALLVSWYLFQDGYLLPPAGSPILQILLTVYLSLSFGGGYAVSFTSILLAFGPRHSFREWTVPSPDELEHAGREVTLRKASYDVRVTRSSILRVYEGGTYFRCLPSPNVLWALALVSMAPPIAIVVFPVVLYIHRECWKVLGTLFLTKPAVREEAEERVEDLLRDSLMRTYMLAREAGDIRRASLQDQIIVVATISLLAWAALLALSARTLTAHGSFIGLILGTAAIAALAIGGSLVLRRLNERKVAREEEWAGRLLSVIRGEDKAGSAIELLLLACREVPGWISLHRKGVWTREPGKTLLTFILLLAGSNGLIQYGSIWWGFLLISLALLALGILLFSWMFVTARYEARDLALEWDQRMREMDSLLDPEGER
ncbi:MAG: hypothetical protein KBA58_01935 [Methanomassiliicoccales archaeon]|nr:hypothetical protein [Methanomassiliicoccales archaeon]